MRYCERIFHAWLWRLPPGGHEIALTFDDGPDPISTPRLLCALDDLKICATMFLIGEKCNANPGLVKECAAAGHKIALHGYAHRSFLWRSSQWQSESILKTIDALSEAGVAYEPFFRPPYGRFNPLTQHVLRQHKLRGVMWSKIARDWVNQEAKKLAQNLTLSLHAGDIILLHDQTPTIDNVIKVLPQLAESVRHHGWRFAPLTHNLHFQPVSL